MTRPLEYTLFDETDVSAKAKGYRNLKTTTLAAGLAGIQQKIEPHSEVIGNGYEQQGISPDFPRLMPEAIARLKSSSFAREWLGDRFVETFSVTRQSQFDAFSKKYRTLNCNVSLIWDSELSRI